MSVELTGRTVLVAGLGVSGAAAARVLLRARRPGAAHRRRRARRRRRAGRGRRAPGSAPLETVPDGTDLVVTSPGLAAGRPAAGRRRRPRRRGGGGAGAGLAAAGGRARTASPRPGWRSPAPTARRRRSRCSRRSCWRPDGARSPPATSAARWSRWSPPSSGDGTPTYDVVAVELSSFQLHWSSSLAPAAAAVLNVADDHTDWHGSFAAYRDAKARILRLAPVAVADAGDPVAAALVAGHPHPVTVTLGEPAPGQLGVRVGGAGRPRVRPPTRRGSCCWTWPTLHVPGPAQPGQRPGRRGAGPRDRHPRRGGRPRPGRLPRRRPPQRPGRPPSAGSTTSTTARPPTRTPPAPRSPPTRGWSGSPAACSRVPTSIRWSRRSPDGSAGVVLLGRDRDRIAASLARHAPMVPVVTVASGDDDGMDGTGVTAEATMTQVVARRGRARPARRHGAAGPGRRLDGRLPRLRPPRAGLRRRGAGRWAAGDHEHPAPRSAGRRATRARPRRPGTSARRASAGPAWLDGPMTSAHLVLRRGRAAAHHRPGHGLLRLLDRGGAGRTSRSGRRASSR